ncbi:MAG: L-lactate dehydrogenase [Vicinamibacteria bacterium]|nr:L-lactate dehydrogenase [Vicinamibacteria bacterium]
MSKGEWKARKVVIVGAGAVGSTFAYALAQSGQADEIVLLDVNPELAKGQVLDLGHGLPFFPSVDIRAGDKRDFREASIVVITAGAGQRPGESRLDLLQRNAAIVGAVVDDVVAQESMGVVLVVSNPVDILTHVAQRRSGWPRGRVIGSGTVLDSARLRYMLSRHCGIDARNVHAYVIGEHGDSELVPWSLAHIGGVVIDEYCPTCGVCADWAAEHSALEQTVRDSAYHIINYKGATWFAIGLALVKIVEAILRNQRSVLTVSSRLEGEYGLHDVCLSVPSIVSGRGVERIIETPLRPKEAERLRHSAEVLRASIEGLARRD